MNTTKAKIARIRYQLTRTVNEDMRKHLKDKLKKALEEEVQ